MASFYRSLSQGAPQSLEDGPSETCEAAPCLRQRKVFLGSALLVLLLLVGVGLKVASPKEEGLTIETTPEIATGIEGACTYGSASGDELGAAHCSMGAASLVPHTASGSLSTENSHLPDLSYHAARGGWTLPTTPSPIATTTPSPTPSTTLSSTPSDPIGNRVFHIAAIRSRGKWVVKNHTPDEVLTLLRRMRTLLGSSFSLYCFVEGQQPDPNVKIGPYTLDAYLLLAQEAAGGVIIPEVNLDFWINPFNQTMYPCADGSIGPSCFWQVSDQMLALKAIAAGPKIASLNSWMTFNRCPPHPGSCAPADIQGLMQALLQRGWKGLLPLNFGPYFNPTYGLARGMVTGLTYMKRAPWLQPTQVVVNEATQYPGIAHVFAYINSQTQICPMQADMDIFLANYDTSQKMVGLRNMAASQASGKYTFMYPLWVNAPSGNKQACDARNGNPGYFDATSALQTDQTPFFDLIMSLVKQYN